MNRTSINNLRLFIFGNADTPNAGDHEHVDKCGYLKLLVKKTFFYRRTWKNRYCVLANGKFYYYENENSLGSERTCDTIPLRYYDHVGPVEDSDRISATNIFVIESKNKDFYESESLRLSAESPSEREDWIKCIRKSLECIQNNNSQNKRRTAPNLLTRFSQRKPQTANKEAESTDTVDGNVALRKAKEGSGREKQRPLSDTNKDTKAKKLLGQQQAESSDILSENKLECITRLRVRGPSGRRAPRGRRTALSNHRSSSLSTLQTGDAISNGRSHSSLSCRNSTQTANEFPMDRSSPIDGNSPLTGSAHLSPIVSSSTAEPDFGDLDNALFFRAATIIMEADEEDEINVDKGESDKIKTEKEQLKPEKSRKNTMLFKITSFRKSLRRKKSTSSAANNVDVGSNMNDQKRIERHSSDEKSPGSGSSHACVIL